MASMNKCIFIGNVTSDVDNRVCKTGLQIASFSIAVNEKGKQGDVTTFINIKVFGKLAEICKQYLAKGSSVLIEGKYRIDTWEDKKNNTKRYNPYISADNIQFLSSRQAFANRPADIPNNETAQSKYPPSEIYSEPDEDMDDVVPF